MAMRPNQPITTGSNAMGPWQLVPSDQVVIKPQQPQQPVMPSSGQQDWSLIDALKSMSASQQQAEQERANQMASLRNRRSGYSDLTFNRLANPFGADNAYLKGLNASSIGQTYGQMGDAIKNMREDLALRGITQNSGLAQSQELGTRQGAAGQASQMLNDNANQNYRLGAQFDQDQAAAERAFNVTKASAMDRYDFDALDRLRNLNQDRQNAANQNPLEQLKVMQGQADLERYRQMTPLELERQRGVNTEQSHKNHYTGETIDGKIASDLGTYRVGAMNSAATMDLLGRLMNDPNFMDTLVGTYKNRAMLGGKQATYDNQKQDWQPLADGANTAINGLVGASTIYNNLKGSGEGGSGGGGSSGGGFWDWLGSLFGGKTGQGQAMPTTSNPGVQIGPLPGSGTVSGTSSVFGTPTVPNSTLPSIYGGNYGDFGFTGSGSSFGTLSTQRYPYLYQY